MVGILLGMLSRLALDCFINFQFVLIQLIGADILAGISHVFFVVCFPFCCCFSCCFFQVTSITSKLIVVS